MLCKLVCTTALLQRVRQLSAWLRHNEASSPTLFLAECAQNYFRKYWKEVCSPCVGERLKFLIRSWDILKNMWFLNKFGAATRIVKKENKTGCNKSFPIHLFCCCWYWNIQTCNPITYVVNRILSLNVWFRDKSLHFPDILVFSNFVGLEEHSIFFFTTFWEVTLQPVCMCEEILVYIFFSDFTVSLNPSM